MRGLASLLIDRAGSSSLRRSQKDAMLRMQRGTTVVQVTHSAAMAAYGGRIVHIKDGAICG